MLALQQCLPVQLDQHRLPVTVDLHECCHCLPPVDCKITLKPLLTTLSGKSFGTALQTLALTYLLQYAEYANKYARKYAEYDKKHAAYDKKYAEQSAKYVQICSICNLVYCDNL
jgi:hypothetical protein